MNNSYSLRTDRSHLSRIALDTREPRCQVCGETLHEGDDITVYAYRPAGEPTYEIGYLMCGHDTHEHPTVLTRGVRELVVTGHIGSCANTRTQSTIRVLLAPTIVVTSATASTEPDVHPDTATPRSLTKMRQEEPIPLLTAVRGQSRAEGGIE
ncbi:hypothetical protein PM085_18160 [Halorubrum ezzemoulense]|uniref:DUF8112 domain-containing protein n=1 Tax=Halorubrum ezzemoulense TaxID=337243 RepID=A0ABT4Z7L4_HALEZ|nr:hypothetical protein [Halorubrum ezzemoulense]MDB2294148.1 hypothetical protein [Halorubrum ezzemoulense]